MSIFISPSKYKIIISFYFIIINADIDIYLKKFNYKKIFYKKKMAKFNKEEIIIKDL